MKVIVGLGNPGGYYEKTRHNLGLRIVQYLSNHITKATFLKSERFMNESGKDVAKWVAFYKLDPKNLLVIHDELDLTFGEMKLQFNRGTAGHNGVDSVTRELGTSGYWRLRVGIGSRGGIRGDRFVLANFSENEIEKIRKDIEPKAQEIVSAWVEDQY
jgi:peptidyl-tRNA hydrolase, PTH1 family